METCVICSKLEMSLSLQLQYLRDVTMRSGPHVWSEPTWRFEGPTFVARGTAAPRNRIPKLFVMPEYTPDGSAALTHDVPLDFSTKWFEQNAEHMAVKNGLIWLAKDKSWAISRAREFEILKCGFEPLGPVGEDKRWPTHRPASHFHYGEGAPKDGIIPPDWAS